MTFASNVQPKRRIRHLIRRGGWKCNCVIAGRVQENSYYLTRCGTCGVKRP